MICTHSHCSVPGGCLGKRIALIDYHNIYFVCAIVEDWASRWCSYTDLGCFLFRPRMNSRLCISLVYQWLLALAVCVASCAGWLFSIYVLTMVLNSLGLQHWGRERDSGYFIPFMSHHKLLGSHPTPPQALLHGPVSPQEWADINPSRASKIISCSTNGPIQLCCQLLLWHCVSRNSLKLCWIREEQSCASGTTLFAMTMGFLYTLHLVVVMEVRGCCQFPKISPSRTAVIMA